MRQTQHYIQNEHFPCITGRAYPLSVHPRIHTDAEVRIMRHVIRTMAALLLLGIAGLAPLAIAQAPAAVKSDLATLHAERAALACSACHGDVAPLKLTAEESLATANRQCIVCHGSGAKLAEALAPRLPNKHVNPHASHLVEIDCATCHRGHAASESFCLQCHAFDMPMPGSASAGRK